MGSCYISFIYLSFIEYLNIRMSKVHIISDLFLEFNESSEHEQVLPEGTDLVIFNGNIGKHIKRGFLYMETLCNLYPDVQFVVNLGDRELYSAFDKYVNEIINSIIVRRDNNTTWPKNLHFDTKGIIITLRDGTQVDVLCTYGHPKIYSYDCPWEDTIWYRNHHVNISYDMDIVSKFKPNDTSLVMHGSLPIFATPEDIEQYHEEELKQVRKWEITPSVIKILVTHINPYQDSRLENTLTTPYNIHLEKGYWVGSDTLVNGISFLGSRLYSNPGRGIEARSRFFTI